MAFVSMKLELMRMLQNKMFSTLPLEVINMHFTSTGINLYKPSS